MVTAKLLGQIRESFEMYLMSTFWFGVRSLQRERKFTPFCWNRYSYFLLLIPLTFNYNMEQEKG